MPRGGRKGGQARGSVRARSVVAARADAASAAAVPRETLAQALARRPRVDFQEPLMRHAAMQAKGIGLCAFLVTLAAFQRGLQVTFHYQRATQERRFAGATMQGHRGEVFSLSNGERTHTFSRTLGDRTDPAANAIAEDKHLTRAALKRAGVRTPDGLVVEKGQTTLIGRFLERHPDGRFVVKPLAGSMARDVTADLPAEAVLPAVEALADGRLLVEEYVAGDEYRATVVDGRCVAVSLRRQPAVIGDGRSTLQQLIATFGQRRVDHPYLDPLDQTDLISAFLARRGQTFGDVPASGERVQLANTSYGVDHEDLTASAPQALTACVESAAKAIGLFNCGIDVIVDAAGVPCVLELNQRSYIGMHGFPTEGAGQGNAVAEALVDAYFPETIHDRVHPALAYDFAPVRAALESAQLAELRLPVIGPDWQVGRMALNGVAAAPAARLFTAAARVAGVHLMQAPLPEQGVALCLAYTPATLEAMRSRLPEGFRKHLDALPALDRAGAAVAS